MTLLIGVALLCTFVNIAAFRQASMTMVWAPRWLRARNEPMNICWRARYAINAMVEDAHAFRHAPARWPDLAP
jgi:hypothetical protein